jgi:hypothetical protein
MSNYRLGRDGAERLAARKAGVKQCKFPCQGRGQAAGPVMSKAMGPFKPWSDGASRRGPRVLPARHAPVACCSRR